MLKRGAIAWIAIGVMVPMACASASQGDTANRGLLLVGGIIGLTALTMLSERWRKRSLEEAATEHCGSTKVLCSPIHGIDAAEAASR